MILLTWHWYNDGEKLKVGRWVGQKTHSGPFKLKTTSLQPVVSKVRQGKKTEITRKNAKIQWL